MQPETLLVDSALRADEQLALSSACRDVRVMSSSEIRAHLRPRYSGSVKGAVLAFRTHADDSNMVPQWWIEASRRTPLVFRAEASPQLVSAISQLSRRAFALSRAWRLWLRDDTSLTGPSLSFRDLEMLPPFRQIIEAFTPWKYRGSRDILVAAALAGVVRRHVPAFARSFGWSERTVSWLLRREGLPDASSLLAWALILHTVWRLDVLRQAPKRVAFHTGYAGIGGVSALSEFIFRRTGRRLRTLRSSGSFATLQSACLAELSWNGRALALNRRSPVACRVRGELA